MLCTHIKYLYIYRHAFKATSEVVWNAMGLFLHKVFPIVLLRVNKVGLLYIQNCVIFFIMQW